MNPIASVRREASAYREKSAKLADFSWAQPDFVQLRVDAALRTLETPLCLSFIGNFKAGKSSVVNSLLDEDVAPVDDQPTTACVTRFTYASEKAYAVEFQDGALRQLSETEYSDLVDHTRDAGADDTRANVAAVHVTMPHQLLSELTLVDTPGLGSLREQDDEATKRHLRRADAVCWVFKSKDLATKEEVHRVRALSPYFRTAFAIINQSDKLPPSQLFAQRDRLREHLGDCFEEILFYSATSIRQRKPVPDFFCSDLVGRLRGVLRARADYLRAERARDLLHEAREEHLAVLEDFARCTPLNGGPAERAANALELARLHDFETFLVSHFNPHTPRD